MEKDPNKQKGISRRGFLKSGALAVVGSSFLLSACGKGKNEKQEDANAGKKTAANQEPSFLKAPAPIKDSDIKETVEADVVVVGAGMAGLCAAISAAQEGAKVVVIEKTQSVNFRSYDYGAINAKVQKEVDIEINPLDVTREIMKFASYKADQKVVQQFVDNSGKVNDWLLDLALQVGCKIKHIHKKEELVAPVSTLPTFPTLTFVLEPPEEAISKIQQGIYGGRATIAVAYTLLTNAEKAGVTIRYKTPAEQLVRQDNKGRVTGVIGKAEDGKYIKFNAKKGVILCAGDYGHDEEMLKYYVPTSDSITKISYPGKYNTGDGQKMGMWIGAAIDEGPHCAMYFDKAFVADPKVNPDSLVRQPWLGVNMKGERYGNEDLPFSYLSNQVRQQPGKSKWNIWDSKWPEEGPKFRQTACKEMLTIEHHNPKVIEEYIAKGLVKKADTIEQLAELTNLPAEPLKKTIARYNELAKKGVDEDFGKPSLFMTTIEKPPFYAANIGTSMLVTLGGLQINDNMQVLDTEKNVIPGLYAAGNNSGCFYGADYPNFIPGNSHGRAYTFGYLSGKNASKLG
ncbi:FAD-dependent oxidoreductase [Sporomusa acidovorans]|uniref:Urocanate reductase n=1 Tax=Sporomusa acidovorans (strain ATCC 49682 / DSM 3132 / Mol) TaxID=1123286 RepID=A0ABZ3J6J9_SPOA4|nr:FAD-dependent oxidoreductase [Sporomusa acidovorans]OZC21013.1 urocanate reductase precursor [Sporomusa acidovorans DSM 3132]SDF18406.1 fumarate reductase flavoprotein subunit [Sporomusa acidovorans]